MHLPMLHLPEVSPMAQPEANGWVVTYREVRQTQASIDICQQVKQSFTHGLLLATALESVNRLTGN